MMDVFLRAIAIFVEVAILTGLLGCFLVGVGLTVFDLGMKPKYKKAVFMALVVVGGIIVVFFISHLTAWYTAI